MLRIRCSMCKKLLTVPGALIFSPPDREGKTYKYHICYDCYFQKIPFGLVGITDTSTERIRGT